MLTKMDLQNQQFFNQIAEISVDELTKMFPRTVVILHPGTEVKDDGGFPFRAPNSDDIPPSSLQVAELERLLLLELGADAQCSLAVYAGYMREEEFHLCIQPHGAKHNGNLRFILFNGTLEESLFRPIKHRWDWVHLLELSFLWARDRSWLVVSTPDTAVTIIGCGNRLADVLVGDGSLGAFDWPLTA